MNGLDPQSPFSVFLGTMTPKQNTDPHEKRDTKWTLPKAYLGKNSHVDQHVRDMNLKGFNGDYEWAPYYDYAPRTRIRFYTLFACLERIDIHLPMELHVYLWDIYKELERNACTDRWMHPDSLCLEWTSLNIQDGQRANE